MSPSPSSTLPPSGDRLLVSERFISMQGEGVSTGVPAAFLRLGNCNLQCSYCDTPYTWDSERYDLSRELVPQPVEQVAAWILQHAPGRLILTGGEPLLQQRLIVQLLEQLDVACERARLYVEVETNGTVPPASALLARIDQWNVSPKLGNSGETVVRRRSERVLQQFSALENAFFKFVPQTLQDVAEVDELVRQYGLVAQRVQLMPEARDKESLRERAPTVASWAQERSYRYSGRLHLELYDGKRGR